MISRNLDVVKEQRRRVRQPNAVLVLGLSGGEPGRVLRNDEPRGAVGGHGQHSDHVGNRSVGDPLLSPVDAIPGDDAVLFDSRGGRLHRAEVAACVGLGGAVRKDHTIFRDRTQPALALFVRGSHEDRITAEERREDGSCETDVVPRHHLTDPVRVERATVHPAVHLRDEHQLHAELIRVTHRADDVFWAHVFVVEVELTLRRQFVTDKVAERLEHHQEGVGVEAGPSNVACHHRHRVEPEL